MKNIGPTLEPRRIRILKEVGQRLIERELWRPTRVASQRAPVAYQQRRIGRAHPRRVFFDGDLYAGDAQKSVDDLAHRHSHAAADVVDLAWPAALCEQPIGRHNIAHVEKIALRGEVADAQYRRLHAGAYGCDLSGERRRGECVALPRTGVIE